MTLLAQIKGVFSQAAVAVALDQLDEMKSTIVDTLFPATVEHPSAHIGVAALENAVGTQPVVRRDGQPVPFQGPGDDIHIFAPRPIKPSIDIAASELNDLQAIFGNKMSRDQYVARKVDQLRRLVRNTTEAMASVVATTGQVSWPSRLDGGGHETYELVYGDYQRKDLPAKWTGGSPPTLKAVYNHLADLRREIQKVGGGGGKFKFLAGQEAFGSLLDFAESWKSTAQGGAINLVLDEGKMIVGGFEIMEVSEQYQSPLDKQWVAKIPPKSLLGYAAQNTGQIFYLAIDSISNNGQPTPFYVAVEEKSGDAAISLIAQAKPLPVIDLRSVILSEVVA